MNWRTVVGLTLGTWLLMIPVGCSPESIAPLPSPVDPLSPDATGIVVSSLTVEAENPREELVAIIGIDGTVVGAGQIRIANARNEGTSSLYESTDAGGFVATLLALPNDSLKISFIDADGAESRPIIVKVRNYKAPKTAGPAEPDKEGNEPDDDPDNAAFAEGGTASDANSPPSAPASSAKDLDGDGDLETILRLTLIYSNGTARLVGAANFVGANDLLVIANQSSGGVYAAAADNKGAIDHAFPAAIGDVVIVFSQNPLNTNLTSPAVSFVVAEGTTKLAAE